MLKKIMPFFNTYKENKKLKKTNESLEASVKYWENTATRLASKAEPELVIERLLQRGIGWYDYKSLEMSEQRSYYGDIQNILATKAFKNEVNHYIADIIQEIAKTSRSYEEIINMRMIINSMLVFRDRLESIENPDKPKAKLTNPHSVI